MVAVSGDGCTLGRTDLIPTSANQNPGLYIDSQNPSPCSGQIIRWRVCYYNPRVQIKIDTDSLKILLQTWSLSGINGTRIGSNFFKVAIPQQPENFQCVNITVDPSDYITVSQGHYLGVYLAINGVLPVIGNTVVGTGLLYSPSTGVSIPSTIQFGMNGLTAVSSNAIHVTATIGRYVCECVRV